MNYLNAFNVFKCRRNILDRLDVLYERACMAIQSTICGSAYFNSMEQVDANSKLEETFDAISDSKEQVNAESKAKAYKDYIIKNKFEPMNVFERENNSGSRINPDSRTNPENRINPESRINSSI